MESLIAIDFGTSQTTAAIINDGKVETVNFDGKLSYPTIACINKGKLKFASSVESTMGKKLYNMKLLVGRNKKDLETLDLNENRFGLPFRDGEDGLEVVIYKKKEGEEKYVVRDIIKEFIKYIIKEVSNRYNRTFSDAIITVPVRYGSSQREAYRNIVESAGLNVRRLLNESTAAIVGYVEEQKVDNNCSVVIYDLGGGTFDTTLISITSKGCFQVKDSCGHNNIGGELFDNKIASFIIKDIQKKHPNLTLLETKVAVIKLLPVVRAAKESLSNANCKEISVDIRSIICGNTSDISPEIVNYILTRKQVESLIADDIKTTIELVKGMLKRNSIRPDHLIIVGGASAIPCVTKLIKKEFSSDYPQDFVYHSIRPKEIICRGAMHCANKGYDENILEITSYSYFFSISQGQKFRIIEKGTPIPMKNIRFPFRTSKPQQKKVHTTLFRYDGDLYYPMNIITFNIDEKYEKQGEKTPFDIVLNISDCEILRIDIMARGSDELIYSTRVDVN